MTDKTLFEPYELGPLTLSNRIVMVPLTRNRAGSGLVPGAFAAEYYAQRASAGLIITEATQVSEQAQGYQDTPGLYTPEQIAGWRNVTEAVHARGGRIFVQLWHVGRISHVDLLGGKAPVAPSAIRAETKTFVNNGFADVSEPRALESDEIPAIVESFRQAAANAIAAGFDGVEVHSANDYLLDQFLRETANVRTDACGGSIVNRTRLLLEVTDAVSRQIGADRTGLRLSPVSPASGIMISDNEQPQFDYVVEQLDKLGIAYIHVVEGATGGPPTSRRSSSARSAVASHTPTSPTTATISNSQRHALPMATQTCSPSVGPSSLIPIWWSGCKRARRWRRPILPRSMAGEPPAMPIIPPSPPYGPMMPLAPHFGAVRTRFGLPAIVALQPEAGVGRNLESRSS